MVALVPVKALARAKSRLAGTLAPHARARLMHDTLRRTLEVLGQVEAIHQRVVITRDDQVAHWAQAWGATVMQEHVDGLNESLREARAQLADADALLVVPADLGWLAVEDVRAMVALAGSVAPAPAVVIAPDRHERGTNALLLQPPGVIDFAFGPDSAQQHARRALDQGIVPQWYRSSSISLDVDEPDDLTLYDAAPYVL
ncbi:MAG: 2-phospho-L-lactate guanylyltransferase [Chloroflexi bacterium]|nr:2-phospho-L-lactate guanylyltransferase [Chloroflexota bacterium]